MRKHAKQPDQIGGGKPGPGRPKGSLGRRTRLMQAAIGANGYDANILLDACFAIVQDPDANRSEVVAAASTALPYIRPKLSAIEVSGGTEGNPVRVRVIRDEPKDGK